MKQLNILTDGALLIRNGVIDEVGPARRIENLANARNALEIDASRKIVLPAFVDADGVLVVPSTPTRTDPADPLSHHRVPLRVLSRRVIEAGALSMMSDSVRSGILSIGAHTGYAATLKDVIKVLLVHGSLKNHSLRIRSILSPHEVSSRDLIERWLPTIGRRRLAAVVEFSAGSGEDDFNIEQLRLAATAAADHGFAIRIRVGGAADDSLYEFASQAGAIAWMGLPPRPGLSAGTEYGGVYVLPISDCLDEDTCRRSRLRQAIDEGIPLAIASRYGLEDPCTANPQFTLYLATRYCGFSCEEAIMAAIYNAACALKMSHVTGSLEPGKSADLVVMDVPDYRELFRRVGHADVFQAVRKGLTVYRRGEVGTVAGNDPVTSL